MSAPTVTTPRPGLRLRGAALPLLDRARVYVCGITPYDVTHLGHAAVFVWIDVLTRLLHRVGVEPEVCRNITDVDDVLLVAANRADTPYDEFAAMHQFRFDSDMAALGVRRPRHEPRAHTYVEHVIRLTEALVDNGRAYLRDGSVFFRGADVPARVGLDRDTAVALAAAAGGHPDDRRKEDPLDTVLWQAAGAGEPAWLSPWAPGRPGWHAECAAMAIATFGPALDIHAGGRDLLFPHHAYESAIAEAVTGVRPFARRWLHVGIVSINGAKMAKSAGNLVLVSDLVARFPAAAVRLLLLERDLADDWSYRPEELEAAAGRLERLYAAMARPAGSEAASEAALAALLDDLNVSRALAIAEEHGGAAARTVATVLGLL